MKLPLIFVTLLYLFAILLLRAENTLSFICEQHINPPGYAEWCYFTAAILLYACIVVFGALTLRVVFLRMQQQRNTETQPKKAGFIKAPWQEEHKSSVEPEKKAPLHS